MPPDRLFLDTLYIQALLSRADQHHARAARLAPRLHTAAEVWTTEAVLTEIGNALGATNRAGAGRFIAQCYVTSNMRVVTIDRSLFLRAFALYQSRPDKDWGLTDCITFTVMHDQNLTDALTADHHFTQAGFHALLLHTPTP